MHNDHDYASEPNNDPTKSRMAGATAERKRRGSRD